MQAKTAIKIALLLGISFTPAAELYAETYLTTDQARKVLWANTVMDKRIVILTDQQMESIEESSDTRVGRNTFDAWKTSDGGWFIVDQVVGKHEMIDFAIALTHEGKVTGVEVLQYRETYGDEVKHPKWLAQFIGKDHTEILRLDNQIKNISGATLSSRHITDGVNRLTHTWDQVLRHL